MLYYVLNYVRNIHFRTILGDFFSFLTEKRALGVDLQVGLADWGLESRSEARDWD